MAHIISKKFYSLLVLLAYTFLNHFLSAQSSDLQQLSVPENPLISISGESDPRIDLLRDYSHLLSIDDVALLTRDQALALLKYLANPHVIDSIDQSPQNIDAVIELIQDTGAPLPEDLLSESALLANLLLTDALINSDPIDSERIFTRQRLMINSFSTEVVKLVASHSSNEQIADSIVNLIDKGGLSAANGYVGELSQVLSNTDNTNVLNARHFNDVDDLFGLTTDDFTAFAGKNVTISAGSTVDVSKWVGRDAPSPDKTKVFTFAAGEDLKIEGDVTFTNGGHEEMDHALAVGAASDLVISEGATVKYDGSNFGLGAAKSIRIVKVSLETQDHLGLGTLNNLEVVDSELLAGSGNRVLLYAQNEMNVDGLTFSDGLGQVYMEATTLNLQNLDFPSGSDVRLVSELGGIDGRYPNFGSSEAGRVNFISGVSYGGASNIMNDQASFDDFGDRISIESFGK